MRELETVFKDQLIENKDVLSFYFVNFDLSGSDKGLFNREVDFYIKNGKAYSLSHEGTSLIIAYHDEKKKFINGLFSNTKKKFSLFFSSMADNNIENNFVIEKKVIDKDNRILEFSYKIKTPITFDTYSKSIFPKHGQGIVSLKDFAKACEDNPISLNNLDKPSFKENVKNITEEISNLIHREIPDLISEEERIELISIAIAFIYPSKEIPFKCFSAFVGPNYELEQEEVSAGGTVIFWNKTLNSESLAIRKIIYQSHFLAGVNTAKDLLYKNKIASTISAISAIMSRNMSHNIGSHVLADLVANGKTVSKEELNHFYRYMQNRMDFIAQITTEFPQWTYPAYFNKELMRIFYENYILLDRIGVSEGLDAYDWPKDWLDGNMRGKINIRTYLSQWEIKDNKGNEVQSKWIINEYHMGELNDDLQLAIPGGIVGYHAFYVIIENIIRNSAKHDYATRITETLKLNKNGVHSNDEVIYIRYDGDKNCMYWIIDKNKACKKNAIDVNKLQEKIDECRALVIDSTCFKERPVLPKHPVKLVDDCKFTIEEVNRLYVTCVGKSDDCKFYIKEKNGKKCSVVDKNSWEKNKFPFKVLTSKEKCKLDEIIEKEKYDEIIDFLQKGPLRINIRVDDMIDKDYVWVTIWDNMPHFPTINFNRKNDGDSDGVKEVCGDIKEDELKKRVLKKTEEKNDDYKIVNLFGFMNDRLRQSFIEETGELRKEAWGIAELKICAGFLQNRSVEEIGKSGEFLIEYGQKRFLLKGKYTIEEDENPNYGYPKMLIKALPVEKNGMGKTTLEKEEDDFYFLGYRFWMKKPKTAAIVGAKVEDIHCENRGGA